ncbi:MAG: AAA family ATPase, partial [Anaerolineales bacterium]
MKRRLEVARGLLHHPKLLFLDEPTLGLDPQTRRHIWQYLRELRDRERVTIFMTTHYMEEAENCDRVAIMDEGEIVALDSPARLKAMVGGDVVTVWTSDNKKARSKLESSDVSARLGPQGELIVEVQQGDAFIPEMMMALSSRENGIKVENVNLRRPTLEDVFIKLTGHAIRQESANAVDRMKDRMRRRRGR